MSGTGRQTKIAVGSSSIPLSVARNEVAVVEAGQVVIRNRMKVTMSCDHRVIDGALGAAFLATLKGMLEEPTAILV